MCVFLEIMVLVAGIDFSLFRPFSFFTYRSKTFVLCGFAAVRPLMPFAHNYTVFTKNV
jgi:hypothetical protein